MKAWRNMAQRHMAAATAWHQWREIMKTQQRK